MSKPFPRLSRRRALQTAAATLVALGLLLWWLLPLGEDPPSGTITFSTGTRAGVYQKYGVLLRDELHRDMPDLKVKLETTMRLPGERQAGGDRQVRLRDRRGRRRRDLPTERRPRRRPAPRSRPPLRRLRPAGRPVRLGHPHAGRPQGQAGLHRRPQLRCPADRGPRAHRRRHRPGQGHPAEGGGHRHRPQSPGSRPGRVLLVRRSAHRRSEAVGRTFRLPFRPDRALSRGEAARRGRAHPLLPRHQHAGCRRTRPSRTTEPSRRWPSPTC